MLLLLPADIGYKSNVNYLQWEPRFDVVRREGNGDATTVRGRAVTVNHLVCTSPQPLAPPPQRQDQERPRPSHPAIDDVEGGGMTTRRRKRGRHSDGVLLLR